MFSVSDANKVSDALYKLLEKFEEGDEYTPEEKNACQWLYSYFCNEARNEAEHARSEACIYIDKKLEDSLENLSKKELEYMQIYHPKAYEAYELMKDKSYKFDNYCLYAKIKEDLDYIAFEFKI